MALPMIVVLQWSRLREEAETAQVGLTLYTYSGASMEPPP